MSTIVDVSTLLQLVGVALLAGVGVTVVFTLAIYGATRAGDMRREARAGAASLYAALAVLAVAICLAAVVYGFELTISK